ncbi:MAG: DUF3536 domain-containing protein [Deltaproteobacteria bacterium]|nr:DUF3536 domain-containing protein [Deltaproteobacteria bacterium]
MTPKGKTLPSLVVHGHFYQPPRENPWIEEIELEASASPYHDWNERISDECYSRNARARIYNDHGEVMRVVNNYRYLSFNIGPTLLVWLEKHRPHIYGRILEADKNSALERGGHGNAIAQAYGHAILPLCNDRDRLTQIRWAVADFSYRFGRRPEAMWLPETAVNAATVEDLIAEGMRFVILAPGQARRIRPLGSYDWQDVSGARIDPRHPYRLISAKNRERYIDAFFYDGPVSHAVSFEKLLHASAAFVDRLRGAVDQALKAPQLIHLAVDGETFGHHLRHADRALAHALVSSAPAANFQLTNYGQYLEQHPPTHEVELEPGPDGEGTAWSCAHGVGRWCRDCGCHAGAPQGWNQAWRAPLRQAVNYLRDKATEVFEDLGSELLHDPWIARDDYIQVLLDPSAKRRDRFLREHRKRAAAPADDVRILQLLEAQRHALLSQTSCGWFFNDISGLEAVQVLRYAARAVQLFEELSDQPIEDGVLEILGQARSNLPEMGSGADVYRSRAISATVSPRRALAHYAIGDIYGSSPTKQRRLGFQITALQTHRYSRGNVVAHIGCADVERLRTGELKQLVYAMIHFGSHDFHCAVRPYAGTKSFREFCQQVEGVFERPSVAELLRVIDRNFTDESFTLADMLDEERQALLEMLFGRLHRSFGDLYRHLYETHRASISALLDSGLPMPREFRIAAEYTLSRRLEEELASNAEYFGIESFRAAADIVAEAKRHGLMLDRHSAEAFLGNQLNAAVGRLVDHPSELKITQSCQILELADHLGLKLDIEHIQDLLFDFIASNRQKRPLTEANWPELLRRTRISAQLLGDEAAS